MSAAPIHPAALIIQPSGMWLSLDQAAQRSGLVKGHLARLCRKTWASQKLAELRTPPEGGKPTWQIREDAMPELARVKFPEQIPFDMTALDKPHRELVLAREQILRDWETAVARGFAAGLTKDQATAEFINLSREIDGKRVSRANLYNWQSAYRAQGRAGLRDERRLKDKTAERNALDPFLLEVKRLWLSLRRPKLKTCYDHVCLIADREGWAVPSFWKCFRFIKSLDPRLVIKLRMGEKAFEEQVVPPTRRDYTTLSSNEIWCADHHQLDVIILNEDGELCRPWLTAWEDMRSRKIVGWHLFCHDPNQDTVLIAFRNAVRATGGVPEWAYVDNGKDFDAWALQGQSKWQRRRRTMRINQQIVGGLFGQLGTKVMHAKPYNAKGKPIERFFMTLKTRFSQMLWATYCGGASWEKPEDHAEQLDRGNAPAFEDFRAALAVWVDADYNARPHTGQGVDGQTPDQCWSANLAALRTCATANLELLLQRSTKPATVTNEGVRGDKRLYGKGDPALDPYFGKKVYLRIDPTDISRASAWTAEGDRLIGFLAANGLDAWHPTAQDYRTAEAAKNRVRNTVKAAAQLGPKAHYDTIDFMRERRIKQLAAQRPADPTQPPPVLQPIRTALEGQLAALERAKQPLALRLAAGGERDVPAPPPRKRSILDDVDDMEFSPGAPPTSTGRTGGGVISLAERLGD